MADIYISFAAGIGEGLGHLVSLTSVFVIPHDR